MNTRDALRTSTEYLDGLGIENGAYEASLILAFVLDIPRDRVILGNDEIHPPLVSRFTRFVARRGENREPLAYVLGSAGFRDIELIVSPSVLVPRPSTEAIVDRALLLKPGVAVDMGTGSGAVAVCLARAGWEVIATDVTPAALTVAERNANRHEVKISFREGPLFEPLREKVDLIVSNPPYIPTGVIPSLQKEVLHEPKLALDGGPDGLDVIRPLLAGAPMHLNPGGTLLVEHGYDQAPAVRDLARRAGFHCVSTHKDLDGIDRIIEARQPAV